MANPFDQMYRGTPPWEIGRPQGAVVDLERAGHLHGRVLDVGCGTGENAIFLTSRGHEVVGVDMSGIALARARAKAEQRDIHPNYTQADVFMLGDLGGPFDTVLDCGFFHALTDEGRENYLDIVGQNLRTGGTLVVIAFSDREPSIGGPRRVSRDDLVAWVKERAWVESIDEVRFESLVHPSGAAAWCLRATWVGRAPDDEN